MGKIVFAGDFFYDYEDVRKDIITISQKLDFEHNFPVLNLEAPLYRSENKIKKRGPNLAQSDITVSLLEQMHVRAVCLANNHMMDYGEDALRETIQMLDAVGIAHAGAGCNLAEATAPIVIEYGNRIFAIYNYGWDIEEVVYATEDDAGCAPLKEDVMLSNIEQAVKKGWNPIIAVHWGFEYNLHPQPRHILLAHKLVEQGAALVIGHHPHVMQGEEIYQGKPIFYSLGNFYFGSRRERFQKTFQTQNRYESDFGLTVIYDTTKNICDLKYIHFCKSSNQSELLENCDVSLTDYSNIKLDNSYKKMVKRQKSNHNPVIGEDIFSDIKLMLFQKLVRGFIRSIFMQGRKFMKK